MPDKSSQAFRNIGEMAKEIGVKTHILRYWEEQLPMLQPMKRAGGRRLYRPSDAAMLHQINHLVRDQGYTVKGVRKYLAQSRGGADHENTRVSTHIISAASPAAAASMVTSETDAPQFSIAELKAIRERLSAALAAA